MSRIGYGEYIKRHRIASGFKSQRALAEKTGIDNSTISRIELEVHKPEKRTLQTLAEYLTSTSYVELMVACGYWGEEELLDSGNDSVHEYESSYEVNSDTKKETSPIEEEFIKSIDLTDQDLVEQFNVQIDGQPLTEEETKGIIAYIRSLRTIQS